MGTHISRVKSVDLDSWTDEQLQSVLNWGNARANKYWEAKLAPGHVPSEAKIENFIRTKYELKRWAMDGPMPNPADLDDEGDDEVPLSIVKEKQTIERKVSLRNNPPAARAATPRAAPQEDLIGGGDIPPRASTAGPSSYQQVPPKAAPAPPKAVNPTKESLLGLDFLGEAPAAPPRPASTTGTGGMGGQSRPDLKQSILSLYASAPRPQPPAQQPGHSSSGSFGGFGAMQSPTTGHHHQNSNSGNLNDAFAGLSFGNTTTPKSPQRDAFAGLTSMASVSSNRSTAQPANNAFSGLGGGSFFDSKPTQPTAQHQQKPSMTSTGSFSTFSSATPAAKPAQPSSSGLGDLVDWSTPAQLPVMSPPAPKPAAPTPTSNSAFNLSTPSAKPAKAPIPPPAPIGTSDADVWGNAWGNPEPAAPSSSALKSPVPKPSAPSVSGEFGGWGSSAGGSFANQSIVPGASGGFAPAPPKVAADEEFGGWTSSTGGQSSSTSKPASGFGSDDLFSNVWQ